jgi:hypothetical protein
VVSQVTSIAAISRLLVGRSEVALSMLDPAASDCTNSLSHFHLPMIPRAAPRLQMFQIVSHLGVACTRPAAKDVSKIRQIWRDRLARVQLKVAACSDISGDSMTFAHIEAHPMK